jgi:hypothetical protein
MTYKGLIAYVYPLLPSIYTQNRDIIDWYITELKKPFQIIAFEVPCNPGLP